MQGVREREGHDRSSEGDVLESQIMNSSRCHLRLSPAIVTVRIVCYSTTSPESPSIIINRQTRKPPQVFPPSRPPSLRPLIDSANPRSRLPTSDVIDGAEDARARAHTRPSSVRFQSKVREPQGAFSFKECATAVERLLKTACTFFIRLTPECNRPPSISDKFSGVSMRLRARARACVYA